MLGITKPSVYNVDGWIEENKQDFLPPVCNKMMHKEGQMKLFFVGGPNQRKDFHIEAGEELFMQLQGDMVLKIVERGKHRDVRIKQGEMFLLPGRIPHSPQRFENTVGLVLERDRHEDTEKDGLRYYIEENGQMTLNSLYEKWFYCTDLGSQLAPIIKGFFASEQYKTGKPIAGGCVTQWTIGEVEVCELASKLSPGTIPETIPLVLDTETIVEEPFSFQQWIDDHRREIDDKGKVALFDTEKYQFRVFVFGKGEVEDYCEHAEIWIWQWEGNSTVNVDDEDQELNTKDSILIPAGKRIIVKQTETGCSALVCYQDPTMASTWPSQ